MSKHTVTRRLTTVDLAKMKSAGEKIAMLTCYDASFAQSCDAAGIDSILVGDSLGMVVQGHDSTLPVTVEHVAYHIACVARGCSRPLIIGDLPFGSFQESPQAAYRNAVTLMAAGAQMVKLEGGVEMAETTRFLTSRGIPVCAHIGLTPQSVHQLGGYRVQGKDEAGAAQAAGVVHDEQGFGLSVSVWDVAFGGPAKRGSYRFLTDKLLFIALGNKSLTQSFKVFLMNSYPFFQIIQYFG